MPFTLPPYTWDKDRELCKRCKHYLEGESRHEDHGKHAVMLCRINPYKGRRGIGTCSDNRNRGPCGKEGKLFEAIDTAAR